MTSLTRLASSVALCCALTAPAYAAVSEQEAAQLGSTLTPIGAEKSGNAAGTIPEWQGGLPQNASNIQNGFRDNPFANEKPLFIIDAKNYTQYQDKLSPGQVALFKRYPDTYKMPVYTTHRSAGVPDEVAQAIRKNAVTTTLVEGGNGIDGFKTAIPFPIPQNGLEVIWNHIARYRGKTSLRQTSQAVPQANGAYVQVDADERFALADQVTDYDPKSENNLLYFYNSRINAPARLAGNVLLVHETLNQVKEPRLAWLYNSGQRRVRRAPQVSYDGPGTASDGMRTADGLEHFNGSPDRYEWKLVGKREMYIPYNSYLIASPKFKIKDLIKPGHLNPELTRYELHRVWEVVATLKPGERHIYAKRHMFIDEDTWAISLADHYDNRDALWRVGESHLQYFYDAQVSYATPEVLYDLIAGRYIASGMINESSKPYDFTFKASKKDFLPATLRTMGIR
ncbi:DUF1329 domain-containing protein [Pseudomonas sediminis]|uniref:Outer membrane lipoprotein-sorting protein n=1 Tax=Pseudomonas sediminis TaxID=1691904 RepID=A0A2G5FJ88_9PSED|nr:DUF1329 domain-containing protein [Pseudomonas sediminis]PIA68047.1 outer membrane lipoprotein-sorting protein [Pseudomonas sediminis]